MNNQYKLEDFSEMFKVDKKAIDKVLRKNMFKSVGNKGRKYLYGIDALNFLKYKYLTKIEIIQVPFYVNVYWEIIPSKLNFEL